MISRTRDPLWLWFSVILLFFGRSAAAEGTLSAGQALERFLAEQDQFTPHSDAVEMTISASLSKLHKDAELTVIQEPYPGAAGAFQTVHAKGDSLVRREVIARYLTTEEQAARKPDPAVAVTAKNYRFRPRGVADYNGRPAYVYRVEPKRRKLGIFRGELWLDAQTGSALREWGEFVRSPSWMVKSVYFVRDYVAGRGRAEPRRLILRVETRLFGRADVTVWYERFDAGGSPAPDAPHAGS